MFDKPRSASEEWQVNAVHTMPVPENPKIYHIVHGDRLAAIAAGAGLFSDAHMRAQPLVGTTIGMEHIKERRLAASLMSHPTLHVGQCVPFYFCPRSVMLYTINKRSADVAFKGGQRPIVHLVADLRRTVAWAQTQGMRWAFSLSNAGSSYFEDRCSLDDLGEIDWDAVDARDWRECRERKQAEFLLEHHFPWELVEEIGVMDHGAAQATAQAIAAAAHRPDVQTRPSWYYPA